MRFDDFLFIVFALIAIIAAFYLAFPAVASMLIMGVVLVGAVLSAVVVWRKP